MNRDAHRLSAESVLETNHILFARPPQIVLMRHRVPVRSEDTAYRFGSPTLFVPPPLHVGT